jgi:hypothetical protein
MESASCVKSDWLGATGGAALRLLCVLFLRQKRGV